MKQYARGPELESMKNSYYSSSRQQDHKKKAIKGEKNALHGCTNMDNR